MKDERERCPTCQQPIGPWKPTRICGVCHRAILKGHKWRIENSVIRHRLCDDPISYEPSVPREGQKEQP